MSNRRDFLIGSGLVLASTSLQAKIRNEKQELNSFKFNGNWDEVRQQFNLDKSLVYFAGFLFASHPHPVRDAINRLRDQFDKNPHDLVETFWDKEIEMRNATGKFFGTDPAAFALTDSTTMGLGLLYTGFKLEKGQEILTGDNEHESTLFNLKWAAHRRGAVIKTVRLYDPDAEKKENEIIAAVVNGITKKTRLLALTWVHSSTGVKLPVKKIAEQIRSLNSSRSEGNKIIFCLDGVHAMGVENFTMEELGVDFFVAGLHKWLCGPRGTGLIWGRKESWPLIDVSIHSWTDSDSYTGWDPGKSPYISSTPGSRLSPGGFHSYDHRWALPAAYDFHTNIGKEAILKRIQELNTRIKKGLSEMSHVKLYTPLAESLSAGINCFDVKDMKPGDVVKALHAKKILITGTPYAISYARVAAGIMNNEKEVDTFLAETAKLKS